MSRRPSSVNGALVFQEGKSLGEDHLVVSIYEDSESRKFQVVAYELETDFVYTLDFTFTEFDALFRFNADLLNPHNKDGRFHWVVERVEFFRDERGDKRIVLASQPSSVGKPGNLFSTLPVQLSLPKSTEDRPVKVPNSLASLDDTDAYLTLIKSEAARQKFVTELNAKGQLEQIQAIRRLNRIDKDHQFEHSTRKTQNEQRALLLEPKDQRMSTTFNDVQALLKQREQEASLRSTRSKLKKDKVEVKSKPTHQSVVDLEKSEGFNPEEVEISRSIALRKMIRKELDELNKWREDIQNANLLKEEGKRRKNFECAKQTSERLAIRNRANFENIRLHQKRSENESLRERLRIRIALDRWKNINEKYEAEKLINSVDSQEARKGVLERLRISAAERLESKKLKLSLQQHRELMIKLKEQPKNDTCLPGPPHEPLSRQEQPNPTKQNAYEIKLTDETNLTLKQRAQKEAQRLRAWKEEKIRKAEMSAFAKIEAERKATELRASQRKKDSENFKKFQVLESTRDANERERETRRNQELIQKKNHQLVLALPTLSAF